MSEKKVYPSFVDFKKGANEGDNAFGSLVGYIARDPEQRQTGTGKAVTNTSIPVNMAASNINYALGSNFDTSSDQPIWIEATAWEKQAELVAKSGLAKGDQVVVSGYLSLEEYEGKERVKLNISRFNILRRKNAKAQGGNNPFEQGGEPINVGDDDLPF